MYSEHLKKTYNEITKANNDFAIENFNVVNQVHEYRMDWKPKNVITILLAESHVFTNQNAYNKTFLDPTSQKKSHFVNFVYCLAYGENVLVDSEYGKTPQFWKLFNEIDGNKFKVLIGSNSNYEDRIKNKINLLESLKSKGIWLLDTSIVGIYNNGKKPNNKNYHCILKKSFDGYCSKIIRDVKPEKIFVIGKGVYDSVRSDIIKNHSKISVDWIYQPNARISTVLRNTRSIKI
jgi:hypothetical protein